MLQLVKATQKDIETIANLAHQIWKEHYTSIITNEQINYMLAKMYSYDSLLLQLTEQKQLFYLIHKNGISIGFISVNSDNETNYFLNKFYILQSQSNRGIGTEALNKIETLLKPKTIKLTVNRQNYKSINFYFKNDFTIESVKDFDIGDGYEMNDFVMIKKYN